MEKALFFEGRWNALNNFSAFMVYWHDILWATAEHAYQAAKFMHKPAIMEEIRKARSPHDAKKIARKYQEFIRSDWKDVNLKIMEEILRAKLDQHPYVKKRLLESAGLELIEDSPHDSFWGRGPNWKGENRLGKMWMKIRDGLL